MTIRNALFVGVALALGSHVAAAQTFSAGCTQSSAFLARAKTARGGFDLAALDKARFDSLICGLVGDAVWPSLSALYVLASPDAATGLLNLISSSNTLIATGTPTFSPYVGYTGSATANLTGPVLSSLSGFAQNSASIAVFETGQRGYADDEPDLTIGGVPLISARYGSQSFAAVNVSNTVGAPSISGVYGPAALGTLLIANRTDSGTETLSGNGFATDTTNTSSAVSSTAPVISPVGSNGTAATIGLVSFGSALTPAQIAAFSSRVQAFMTGARSSH